MSGQVQRIQGVDPTSKKGGAFLRIAKDGVFSGMIGALMVVLWFLMLDAIAGHPLYTPSLLGKLLFRVPDALQDPTVVGSFVVVYAGVHFAVFVVFGLVAAYLVSATERTPAMGIFLLFFVIFETAFFIYNLAVGGGLIAKLGVATVIIANFLAAGGMSAYFIWRHPKVRESIEKAWEEI